MAEVTVAPDLSNFEVAMDSWTRPFWDAAAAQNLMLPRCADCAHFRWPPGPFCPRCQSQQTEWIPAGRALIYSFTILRAPQDGGAVHLHAPALIEFPESQAMRFPAAIVDTPLSAIQIGAPLELRWSKASNASVPVFCVAQEFGLASPHTP